MPLIYPIFGGGSPPVATYIGRASSNSNTDTYTFSSQSIGAAASGRMIVLCAFGGGASATNFAASIDGNSMTSVVGSVTIAGAIWRYVLETGTTAEFVVSFGVSVNRCNIEVFTVTGYQSATEIDDINNGSSPPTGTLNVSQGACVIACARSDDSTSCSWTGPTEDSDNVVESNSTFSAAHANNLNADAAYAVTATFGSHSNQRLLAAAWR